MDEKKARWKVWQKALLVILCLFILIAMLNANTIARLYKGVTLFEPSKMSHRFRNLDESFSSRRVSSGPALFTLEYSYKPLPETYAYLGDARNVSDFIHQTGTTGLLVAKGDAILYEEYFKGYTETDRMICWSVSKSFVSALIGIAIDEGHIKSVDDYVKDYVPSLSESGYTNVTIKDVLQMSSGIKFNEDYSDHRSDVNRMGGISLGYGGSLDAFIIALEGELEPGAYNRYVSSDTQVLGMVLREATGVSLSAYTEEKLWKPAGMEFDAYWLIDSEGVESAFAGLNASLRDLVRFGILYLNEGSVRNHQIIPREWVIRSLMADESHLGPGVRSLSDEVMGYGYQWWIPEGGEKDFLAMGIYGQAIYVNTEWNIVIAKTSAYQDYHVNGGEMELESIAFFRSLASQMGGE